MSLDELTIGIAQAIALTKANYPEDIHEDIRLALDQCARAIAFELGNFNPNFDKHEFLLAAGSGW